MYVRKEALLSSQIEGTQASLDDVLAFEAEKAERGEPFDVGEVVNYTNVMQHGLKRLNELPVCLRLIREIHAILLQGVRGEAKSPGKFRDNQNWIGNPGSTIDEASFIPPPPNEMQISLRDLEQFINKKHAIPSLVRCALIHAQFETIHPFLDGNGRVGRLLITFKLCEEKVLHQPLLYLSYYFKAHRQEYYDKLNAIRSNGQWEPWIDVFLRGVTEVSIQATNTARDILEMRSRHEQIVQQARPRGSSNGLRLLDMLYETPYVRAKSVCRKIGVSPPTANTLLSMFAKLELLREMTGQRWGQLFAYEPYLGLLRKGTEPTTEDVGTTK
jgi:Fic family protein